MRSLDKLINLQRLRGILPLALLLCAGAIHAAVITNEDVMNLYKAGLEEKIIIATISQSEPKFDLSTDEILRLKKSGISNAVIAKMLVASAPLSADGSTTGKVISVDPVCSKASSGFITLRTASGEAKLGFKKARKESNASGGGRAVASVLTFGIVSLRKILDYAVISGAAAETRTTETKVEFDGLIVERGLDPNDAIKLVTLYEGTVNNTSGRVLPIGEGTVSYWGSAEGTISHSPLEKFVVPLTFEKVRDECMVSGRTVSIWKSANKEPLQPNEYAVLLEPDRYHDFAVD